MASSLFALLSIAFTLGILHAFDADHVLAVSAMGNLKPSKRSTFIFCRNWAIGHGFTLLLVSFAVLMLGVAIPAQLSAHAETGVALVISLLAVMLLINLCRGMAQRKTENPAARKSAVAVGMLHGLAGSAPLLTVIPLAQLDSAWYALLYLLLFSVGVILAMFVFGGFLNGVYAYVAKKNMLQLKLLRGAIAVSALVLGLGMLVGVTT